MFLNILILDPDSFKLPILNDPKKLSSNSNSFWIKDNPFQKIIHNLPTDFYLSYIGYP